jgi:hypothetical protein
VGLGRRRLGCRDKGACRRMVARKSVDISEHRGAAQFTHCYSRVASTVLEDSRLLPGTETPCASSLG